MRDHDRMWCIFMGVLILKCESKDLGDAMPCGGPPSGSGKVP